MENYNQSYEQQYQPAERGLFNAVEIDQAGKANLAEAAKWAKFLGIIGIVVLGLLFLAGIAMFFLGSTVLQQSPELQTIPFGGALVGGIYLLSGLLYVYPTWAMFKFGSLMRAAVQTNNQATLNRALGYLKGFFKYLGILTVIIIAIYVLAVIAIAVGAGIGAMN